MWLMYALLAALAFGLRGVLYHKTSTMKLDRNLMLCGVFASGMIINGIIMLVSGAEWSTSCLVGIQMGLFSFAASACMFKGFAVGKASIVAILTSLPSVVVVIAAYLLWDEKLHMMQLLAFLVLLIGILTIRYSTDISLTNMQGAQWGLLAMLFFAGNDLSGKWSTLLQSERFPTLFLMFTTGTLCFGLWWLIEQRGKKNSASINQHDQTIKIFSNRSTFGIGLAVGITNVVGMMLILQAFQLGKTGLVSAVIALNVVIILLYTRFVVREPLTKFEVIGMTLAVCGILLIHLFR
ncbi:DMT family transporter [Paenibacillus endoradicis]|uniref:DMT family transporter n=1 Tax=Paenibacillus endoradicis TaxID=2972487 RepID=UPI002158A8CA|nr:DMT family transporter [Paenibacillus endoradicis]MCR8659610.1 DMT family transporter [Paenibacillus endoradicis]